MVGWQVRYRRVGCGTFYCYRCGGDREYRQLAGQSWFSVLLIPVFPGGPGGLPHLRCTQCGTRYRIEVLSVPTTAQMQAALPAGMRAAAVAMLRAGGGGRDRARRRAAEAIREAGLAGYSARELDADLAAGCTAQQHQSRAIRALAAQLAGPAREWFLADVVRIALADGPLTEAERRAAHEIGARLGMTPAQAGGVISVTEDGAAA